MKPVRKKLSWIGVFGDAQDGLREFLVDKPKAWLAVTQERMRDLPKTNYDLGCRFAAEDKLMDAIFRFKVTLKLKPDYPNANYNLGCCYLRLGKVREGRDALNKALRQSPGNADVLFMLATADPNAIPASQRPTRMPAEMVTGFFASQANGYDINEANQRYQAGKVVHDLASPKVKSPAPVVIDLACGSGIAARPWRAAAATIRGIDVTPQMLMLADKATHAEKKLFDSVSVGDVTQLPAALADGSHDVALLVNAAPFIGDLSGAVDGAAKALKDGGIFAITVEPYTAHGGFGIVSETSRFGHSNAYVKQVAAAAGLVPVSETATELYVGVPAQVLVFSKGSN